MKNLRAISYKAMSKVPALMNATGDLISQMIISQDYCKTDTTWYINIRKEYFVWPEAINLKKDNDNELTRITIGDKVVDTVTLLTPLSSL